MKLNKVNDYAVIFHDDDRTVTVKKVVTIGEQTIETEDEILPIENAKQFVNTSGGMTFVYGDVTHGTMVEASNLKKLRRSVALQRVFDYDRGKKIDWNSVALFAIIFGLLIFK